MQKLQKNHIKIGIVQSLKGKKKSTFLSKICLAFCLFVGLEQDTHKVASNIRHKKINF